MEIAANRLALLRERMARAAGRAGREPESVTLLAVSKTRGADEIREMARAGVRDFGESYVREALDKQRELADLALCWHFIGPVQSNKTREIACHFDWVHSVDREKVARRLGEQRPAEMEPLDVCIQVNIDGEATKHGVAPEEVPALAHAVAQLPRLRLRGLMAIPRAGSPDGSHDAFRRLAMTLSGLRHTMPELDTLSMGMSDDFEAAIAEGATIIRPGTALFGPRANRH